MASDDIDPTLLGFHWNNLLDPNGDEHLQGVHRYDVGNKSYLYVTQDMEDGSPGHLATVRMGSRDANGAAYGSNRPEFGTPPASDRVIGVHSNGGFADYKHPGGIAVMDNLLVVGLEDRLGNNSPGRIDLYFIDAPTSLRHFSSIERPSRKASSVGISRLNDGRYLLAVSDNGPNKHVSLYRSEGIGPISEWATYDEIVAFPELILAPGDNKFFQNVDLIKDCGSDRIYMVLAFRDPTGPFGIFGAKSKLARYEILNPDGSPSIRRLGNQRIRCSVGLVGACNLDAGFGAYVNPKGQIFYYATEKENMGPEKTTSFAEFRPGLQ